MSADNWAICPKCHVKWNAHLNAVRKSVRDAYGKVPRITY